MGQCSEVLEVHVFWHTLVKPLRFVDLINCIVIRIIKIYI